MSGWCIEETVFGRCPEATLRSGYTEHDCPEAEAYEVRRAAKGDGPEWTPQNSRLCRATGRAGRAMSECWSEIIKVRRIKVKGLKRTAFPNGNLLTVYLHEAYFVGKHHNRVG